MGHDEPEMWGSHRGEKLVVRQGEIRVIGEKLLLGVDHDRSLFCSVPTCTQVNLIVRFLGARFVRDDGDR